MLKQVRKQATVEITFYNESVVFEIAQTKNDTFTVENTQPAITKSQKFANWNSAL